MTDQQNLFADIKPKQLGNRENIIALSQAVADAMNIDIAHSTKQGKKALFVACTEIDRAGGKPEDVAGVIGRAREANKTYRTPTAIAKHWGEFYRAERPKYMAAKPDPDAYDRDAEVRANLARAERVRAIPQADYARIREKALAEAIPAMRARAEKYESALYLLMCDVLDAEASDA